MRALVRFSATGDTVDEISRNLQNVWASLHPGSEFPKDAEVDIAETKESGRKYYATCTARVKIEI